MDMNEKALQCHKEWNGKLETIAKSKVNSREDLAIAYTPGVAEPCKVIAKDKKAAAAKAAAAPAAAAPVEAPKPTAPGSAGELKLHDVEPKTAAMLMAIVADKMGKPLNELRFISIKEVK